MNAPLRVAVIGSRRRSEPEDIRLQLIELKATAVVSGGASGIDTDAERVAADLGLPCEVIRPQVTGARSWVSVLKAIQQRNHQIVDHADLVLAYPASDRKGGTEMGITYAARIGKPVILRLPSSPTPPKAQRGGRK